MKISRTRILLLLVALAGATFALLHGFDVLAAKNREQIHQELQRVLGKEIFFEKLEASLFGGLGFSAKEFSVADDTRYAATPFVRARELVMGVSLWNLLRGQLVIDALTFKDPEIQIITDESGRMNLSELARAKKESAPASRPRAAQKRERPAVSLLVARLTVRNGRIEYIDRSVKEPAEMRVRNVEMDVAGLDSRDVTTIKFTAAVTEGLGRDVRIEGEWGSADRNLTWEQQPVKFDIQFDSLHMPVIARAVAFLRDKIPRELDVTGPLSLRAKLTGTIEEPRIGELTLKVPLFGSADYNAVLEGTVAFAKGRVWEDARIDGRLEAKPINLAELRALTLFKQNLPAGLVTKGDISIHSRFEGTWRDLRIGALINADGAEFRYHDWLQKPAGSRARLRAGISRGKNGFTLHDSEFLFGSSKMTVSGSSDDTSQARWQLRLRGERGPLATWSRLIAPLAISGVNGMADWDVVISRNLAANGGAWDLRGRLKFADAEFKHKGSGRTIDKVNAEVSFSGDRAQVDNALFRLGSSTIALAASAPILSEASASYRLRSANLHLSDLPELAFDDSASLKDLIAIGELRIQNGVPMIKGSVTSPEGSLQDTAYRNLRAEVTWSPSGVGIKNLSFQALGGKFHADGFWGHGREQAQRIEWTSQLESIELRELLAGKFPRLKSRLDGQLTLRGQVNAVARKDATLRESLKGTGEAVVRRGTLKDFNLIAELFKKGGGSAPTRLSPRLTEVLTELLARRDSPFDTLKTNFTIDQQRIRSVNLLLSTPDYEIAGAGWIAFDQTTRWNGLLALSPRISQEFLRDNKMLRFLMDRRERLTIPFRLEGTLPYVKARPDSRAIMQAVRRGSLPRNPEPPPIREPAQESTERREPLPEALEHLLLR